MPNNTVGRWKAKPEAAINANKTSAVADFIALNIAEWEQFRLNKLCGYGCVTDAEIISM